MNVSIVVTYQRHGSTTQGKVRYDGVDTNKLPESVARIKNDLAKNWLAKFVDCSVETHDSSKGEWVPDNELTTAVRYHLSQ
jgi:hypothetical protein